MNLILSRAEFYGPAVSAVHVPGGGKLADGFPQPSVTAREVGSAPGGVCRGGGSAPRAVRGTLSMVGHCECGSSGIQVHCKAGQVCLRDQGSSSVCGGCLGDTLGTGFLGFCLSTVAVFPSSTLRDLVEGITVILVTLVWPRTS